MMIMPKKMAQAAKKQEDEGWVDKKRLPKMTGRIKNKKTEAGRKKRATKNDWANKKLAAPDVETVRLIMKRTWL